MKNDFRKYLLEAATESTPASLWDYTPERHAKHPDWVLVEQVRFADGSIGMLPEKQAVALSDICDMFKDDEERDFEACDEDTEGGHIVHALRAVTLDA